MSESLTIEKSDQSYHNRYDDWICLQCQNYNYSFRSICTLNNI